MNVDDTLTSGNVVVTCPYCRLRHEASLVPGCAYDTARNRAEDEDNDGA